MTLVDEAERDYDTILRKPAFRPDPKPSIEWRWVAIRLTLWVAVPVAFWAIVIRALMPTIR